MPRLRCKARPFRRRRQRALTSPEDQTLHERHGVGAACAGSAVLPRGVLPRGVLVSSTSVASRRVLVSSVASRRVLVSSGASRRVLGQQCCLGRRIRKSRGAPMARARGGESSCEKEANVITKPRVACTAVACAAIKARRHAYM